MSSILYDEKRSFLFFLLFLFLTAFLLSAFPFSSTLLGWLVLSWGGFGFCRLLFLYQRADQVSQQATSFLILPSRILFGLGQQQDKKRNLIFKRVTQPDIIFWFGAGIAYMAWAIYCSLSPTDIGAIVTLHEKQSALLNFAVKKISFYTIVTALSFYMLIALITFLALSFSYSRSFIQWASYSLFPVFILGMVLPFLFMTKADPFLWPDIFLLKGAGLGRADILAIVTLDTMPLSGTSFARRFMELGSLGSLGFYALLLPPLLVFMKIIRGRDIQFLIMSLCALACLILLLLLDIFIIFSPIFNGLVVLGWGFIVLCWSHPAYPYLTQIMALEDRS